MIKNTLVDTSGRPISSAEHREVTNANAGLRARVGALNGALIARHGERNNSLTGLAQSLSNGTGLDPITSTNPLYASAMYYPLSINYPLLTFLYQTHGVLQTMIDEPVLDAFRGDDGPGFEVVSPETGKDSVGKGGLGELMAFADEIGAWETVKHVPMWGGLYGGSGLVVNAGQDPEKPLDENEVKRGNLEFYDADRWEFSGAARSAPVFDFYGLRLDASRVLTYSGKRAPRMLRNQLAGWGLSAMQSAVEDFNVWLRGRNSLYSAIDKLNIDVYGIKDYATTLSAPGGQETMQARIAATNSILNFSKALILDSEDDYKVVNRSVSGFSELLREIRIGLQGATRLPSVKIWGSAASQGLSAEGAEMENEVYNALVSSRVRTPMTPILLKVLRLLQFAVYGREYNVSIKWKPLRVLSATQEEDIKTSKTTRYVSLYNAKLLDSQEIGKIMAKEGLVPIETKAEQGLLPAFQEVPTTDQMFGGEEDEDGAGEQPAKDKEKQGDGGQPDKTPKAAKGENDDDRKDDA